MNDFAFIQNDDKLGVYVNDVLNYQVNSSKINVNNYSYFNFKVNINLSQFDSAKVSFKYFNSSKNKIYELINSDNVKLHNVKANEIYGGQGPTLEIKTLTLQL